MYSRKGAPILAKAQRDAVCTCAGDALNLSMKKDKIKVNLHSICEHNIVNTGDK